ncbi:MAG: glycoside hydrolase family 2 protein [Kiritimatiellae bacterium]|nr:glycoside hydrolase family 2 protein [Kiritimatiellia bacterium]
MHTISPLFPCLDLSGEWRLDGLDECGAPLSCSATVPGDVHGALLAASLIPDPFHARNEERVQWVAKRDWTYARFFDVPEDFLRHASVILRLEDCDTFATVFVNGERIGETRNRFQRWDFDVKRALRSGRNEIRLVFASAVRMAGDLAARAGRPYPMSMDESTWFHNMPFIRKPACHHGWDWGLSQMTTGPCGRVELVASDGDRIDAVFCEQVFDDALAHCTLRTHAILETGEDVVNVIEIDDPPLWWPNGAGERRFFEYAVPVAGRTLRGRIGLRKLELDTAGGAVAFKVNGRPIFMKGANWIPCDAFNGRQTPARYRDLLESAAAAHMNMLRLWGGGQYEKDAFYDLCDELGLLVWHDQMFSCAVYPADEAFLADVRAETEYQVRRLRDHACIALWCGDNECVGAARGWFGDVIKPDDRPAYIEETKARHAVQEAATRAADPTRRFWPSSPCAGTADFDHDAWHDDSRGDMHVWTVWFENKSFDDYRAYRPRFCSEFGFQSFPSPEVARTFCNLDGAASPGPAALSANPDFEWHQKCTGGNRRILDTMARLFPAPRDAADTLYLSQVQQALAIQTAVEAWRPLRPHCMGTLYWQLNDLWPVSSWSSLEYGGKWKHLHYRARRFYAPVAIMAKPSADGSALEIWGVNDTNRAVETNASVRLLSFGGDDLSRETFRAALPPDSATLLASRPIDAFGDGTERAGRFLSLEMEGAPRNDFFFTPFKDAPLADAKVSASFDGFRVTLSTDAPAFFVWANAEGIRGEFDDNSFTLLPGEPRTIAFSPKDAAATTAAFQSALEVSILRPADNG